MRLRSYHDSDFALLHHWVHSPELLFQFAGTDFTYPLTKEQLDIYRAVYPDRHLYMACTTLNQPVAFGEIIPQEDNIPRLARLLIGDNDQRGKGLGTQFVHLLIEECLRLYQCTAIELFVLDDNIQAQRCYQKKNFYVMPHESFELVTNGQSHLIHKMRLDIV